MLRNRWGQDWDSEAPRAPSRQVCLVEDIPLNQKQSQSTLKGSQGLCWPPLDLWLLANFSSRIGYFYVNILDAPMEESVGKQEMFLNQTNIK